jgi:hypothetical protein
MLKSWYQRVLPRGERHLRVLFCASGSGDSLTVCSVAGFCLTSKGQGWLTAPGHIRVELQVFVIFTSSLTSQPVRNSLMSQSCLPALRSPGPWFFLLIHMCSLGPRLGLSQLGCQFSTISFLHSQIPLILQHPADSDISGLVLTPTQLPILHSGDVIISNSSLNLIPHGRGWQTRAQGQVQAPA